LLTVGRSLGERHLLLLGPLQHVRFAACPCTEFALDLLFLVTSRLFGGPLRFDFRFRKILTNSTKERVRHLLLLSRGLRLLLVVVPRGRSLLNLWSLILVFAWLFSLGARGTSPVRELGLARLFELEKVGLLLLLGRSHRVLRSQQPVAAGSVFLIKGREEVLGSSVEVVGADSLVAEVALLRFLSLVPGGVDALEFVEENVLGLRVLAQILELPRIMLASLGGLMEVDHWPLLLAVLVHQIAAGLVPLMGFILLLFTARGQVLFAGNKIK